MQVNANPEDLQFLMYDLEARKSWDKASVLTFVEISKISSDASCFYMLNKAPWPFANRDFVEQRLVRRRDNGDIENLTLEITHPDYPVVKKVERARTVLGGTLFRKRISKLTGEPTLLVTMITQADMNGVIPAKFISETLPSSLLKWYKTMQAELLKKNHLNRSN